MFQSNFFFIIFWLILFQAQSAALEALLSQLAVRAQLHEARQLSPHAISLPARFHSFAQPMQVTHVGALLAHGADLYECCLFVFSAFFLRHHCNFACLKSVQ
jgi:hypothetical protein